MDLQKIAEMLQTFPHQAAKDSPARTFLEIAGYPQLENVASNILEFFFDTQADHGFKTLFLEALLAAAGVAIIPGDLEAEVETTRREAYTAESTRLDLIIGTASLLVGIENKLFHGLANDFHIYQNHLRKLAGKRKLVCVLLTLYPVTSAKLGDFIPVTYAAFFEQVRGRMGRFVMEADQRYVPFLFDFIQTIDHLRQENNMSDADFRTWVAEHQEEIKDLLAEIRRFKSHLRDQVKALQGRIDVVKHQKSGVKITPWFYEPTDLSVRRSLVYDFVTPENLRIVIDVIVNPTDWEIWIGCREATSLADLEAFLARSGLKNLHSIGPRNFRVGEKLDYNTDRAELAVKIQGLIDLVVAIAQSQQIEDTSVGEKTLF